MQDTVRILHFGDVHLDSPHTRLSLEKSEERRRECRDTFSALMRYARENKVDIVLIPGDLIDRAFATADTAALLAREFAASRDIRIVIAPGNHDYYTPDGIYSRDRYTKNVHIFDNEPLSSMDIDALGVTVWGWAFRSDAHGYSPIAGAHVRDERRINLLCAHCDLDAPLSKYCPVTSDDIAAFGADYAALSHRHVPGDVMKIGSTTVAYSGCPEGRSFDEPGYGGAYDITVTRDEGGNKTVRTERIRTGHRRYESATVDVSGATTLSDAREAILRAINDGGFGPECALRIRLVGATAPTFSVPAKLDAREFGLYYLELRNETSPTFDGEYLEHDLTVRGELYRALKPALTGGSPEDRALAARALRAGLSALEGNDLTGI